MKKLVVDLVGLIAVSALFWVVPTCAQSPGYSPSDLDFELPLQDLDELEGEIIWLQGGLKRGDPSPYRNPRVPLAAYEQGLLDRDGSLWTFLDNPKGRELRYNKKLRGKGVSIKGWLYDKTQIIEVYSWEDSQSHPVRPDAAYPEPFKVPFQSEVAATIEPIPPVTPEIPGKEMIGEDMWKQKEGLELMDGQPEQALPLLESGENGDLLKRFLEANEIDEDRAIDIQTETTDTEVEERNGGPDQIDLRAGSTQLNGSAPSSLWDSTTPSDVNPSGNIRIEEGLTDPEEMFDASRKALLEQ